jgi:sporulation integral membrane protein YlbJ
MKAIVMKKIIYAVSILMISALLLIYPQESLHFSLDGLNLWFQRMLPTLLPVMILSGVMVRMNLIDRLMLLAKPILKPIFRLKSASLYVIVVGFLCGFPMGARVTADLYERRRITKDEATYLLAFVNNIGPIFFLSFALPTIGLPASAHLIFGMYGIPLCYGLILRNTVYRQKIKSDADITSGLHESSLAKALDDSITSGIEGITKLGGYMIFFNLLNIIPFLLLDGTIALGISSGILEITGGLGTLGRNLPLVSLTLLTFGGFSCLAQTFSCLAKTDLSLRSYIKHKLILTILAGGYYAIYLTISGSLK